MRSEELTEKVIRNRLLFCTTCKSFINLQISYRFLEDWSQSPWTLRLHFQGYRCCPDSCKKSTFHRQSLVRHCNIKFGGKIKIKIKLDLKIYSVSNSWVVGLGVLDSHQWAVNHLQGIQKPQSRWIRKRALQKFSINSKPQFWEIGFFVVISGYRLQKKLHVLLWKKKKKKDNEDWQCMWGEYAHIEILF